MRTLRVGIIGCGTAGPALAVLLRRAGHSVEIFERAATPGPVGAGILIQPSGAAVLADLGVLDAIASHAAPVRLLYGRNSRGRVIMDLDYEDLHPGARGLGVQRGLLFTHLLEAARAAGAKLHTGAEVSNTTADGFIKIVNSGTHGPFDLIAHCDGARSALPVSSFNVRRQQIYPWGALWFVADDPSQTFGATLHQVYEGTSTMLGFLPSGRLHESHPFRTSLFWSCTPAHAAAIRATPDSVSSFRELLQRLEPKAATLLEQLRSPNQLLFAEYRDTVLDPLHDGCRVYLGDAAHAMSPQLGQGANLALIDAHTLATSLAAANSLPAALHQYSRARRSQLSYYSLASRGLTPIFQSDENWIAPIRDRLFGPLCRVPVLRHEMLLALAGRKTRMWFG